LDREGKRKGEGEGEGERERWDCGTGVDLAVTFASYDYP